MSGELHDCRPCRRTSGHAYGAIAVRLGAGLDLDKTQPYRKLPRTVLSESLGKKMGQQQISVTILNILRLLNTLKIS